MSDTVFAGHGGRPSAGAGNRERLGWGACCTAMAGRTGRLGLGPDAALSKVYDKRAAGIGAWRAQRCGCVASVVRPR